MLVDNTCVSLMIANDSENRTTSLETEMGHGFCDTHGSGYSTVDGLLDERSVEKEDNEMVGGGEAADSCSIQELETPYQTSLRMLNSLISHTEDINVKKELRCILRHLEDPDTLHVIKHHHLQRAAVDDSTLRYIKGVFNTDNPIKVEINNRNRSRAKAKSNWKRVSNIVTILVALERAKKSRLKLKQGEEGLKDGQEIRTPQDTEANGDGMGTAAATSSFSIATNLLVVHQSAIKSLIGELYESRPSVFTVDTFKLPSLEITTQYNPIILPGLNPYSVIEVHNLLANNDFLSWDFNIFDLDEASNKHSFWYSVMSVLLHFNLPGILDINMDNLSLVLLHVERTYCLNVKEPNVYHNHVHAADTTLGVAHFLLRGDIVNYLTANSTLSLILAAAMHDFHHPGVSNAFLIQSEDILSLMYNDQSILESFHASESYRIFRNPDYNIFKNWDKSDIKNFKATFIKCILATDLSQSFEYISKFQSAISTNQREVKESPAGQMILLQMILKVSDVAHPARPWDIHSRWSTLVTEEFCRQGDREAAENMQISPLCNRNEVNLPKSQCNFIDFIVRPCLSSLCCFCHADDLISQLNVNHAKWKILLEIKDKRVEYCE